MHYGRKHGKAPYHIVALHGGPGAAGSAFGLARLISKEFGVLELMQSKYTIMEQKEEVLEGKAEVNGDLYEKVWKEAAGLRKSGKLLERFAGISCPLVLIQGSVDLHSPEGVIHPLRDCNVNIKSYVLDKCGHIPWRENMPEKNL